VVPEYRADRLVERSLDTDRALGEQADVVLEA